MFGVWLGASVLFRMGLRCPSFLSDPQSQAAVRRLQKNVKNIHKGFEFQIAEVKNESAVGKLS